MTVYSEKISTYLFLKDINGPGFFLVIPLAT